MPADRPETCPPTQRFAVFRNPENPPESWRSWSAYTRDFNTAWRGFVGFYEGHGATRRERKADAIKRARADNRDPMDGIDPTPPAPADDAGCVCGEPTTKGVVHRTDGPCFHRPGPRWDADPLAPEDHAKCAAERHPADDASGAEAMGIPGLDFQPPRDRTPNGYTRVEAYMGQGHVVVMGYPTDESHSCDALGCGSTGAHVIARLPLPATDDAVEEAARAVLAQCAYSVHPDGTELVTPYHIGEFNRAMLVLRAAMRRERESRSDDSRPASGQGGA